MMKTKILKLRISTALLIPLTPAAVMAASDPAEQTEMSAYPAVYNCAQEEEQMGKGSADQDEPVQQRKTLISMKAGNRPSCHLLPSVAVMPGWCGQSEWFQQKTAAN